MTSAVQILALNPNSSASVTDSVVNAMAAALAGCAAQVMGVTTKAGPEGVVSQADYEEAGRLVELQAKRGFDGASAVVVACFSDPGLQGARMASSIPVVGLGEAGLRAALRSGKSVGVVAVADAAIPRHLAYWTRLGLRDSVVNERAINLPVALSGDANVAFSAMKTAARQLRDIDGADVILLGCAGMSNLRAALGEALGIPVVDPCEAAAQAAFAAATGAKDDA